MPEAADESPDEFMPPEFGGGSLADIVPALLGSSGRGGSRPAERGSPRPGDSRRRRRAPLFDASVLEARAVVLFLFDGMGAQQLESYSGMCPTLMGMSAGAITTVAPSTTASALTSVSTGAPPGEHGIVGYRIHTRGGNLNVLGWRTPDGDARRRIVPERFQPSRGLRLPASSGGVLP